jgi:hypothetical protein
MVDIRECPPHECNPEGSNRNENVTSLNDDNK